MDRFGNGIYGIHRSSTETHKSFLVHYDLRGENILKSILTCLYCNKWNKINIWHSDTQKHFANKKIVQMLFCIQALTKRFFFFFSDPNGGV